MKRMVKNGDLLYVEPDGSITAGGKAIKAVEANPTDEATATLEKVKIGDVAYNVGGGGGGGSDYTAGSNIEISESKQIAVKSDLTGINTVRLDAEYGNVQILSYDQGNLKIKSLASYNHNPSIYLESSDPTSLRGLLLSFVNKGTGITNQGINFDLSDTSKSTYVFLTIGSKVPFVPSDNGTYVLKATVSNGEITYAWVAQ